MDIPISIPNSFKPFYIGAKPPATSTVCCAKWAVATARRHRLQASRLVGPMHVHLTVPDCQLTGNIST